MPYYLTRSCPIDRWRVVTERPVEGEDVEIVELPAGTWYGEARAEADRMNGKAEASQGRLPI